jgi:hypothetical protein
MSRLTNESGRLPDRERFAPQARGRKKKSLRQRIAKQVAMGILCSCVATAFYNIAPIKKAVLWICSVVVHVGGDPLSGKDGIASKIEQKLDKAIEKTPHVRVPGGGIPNGNLIHRSPEQLKAEAELKEAERKRREESEMKTLIARAEAVGLDYEDDWTLEKFRVEVPRAEHEAEETAKKKPLLARADKIGLQVDPTADSKTLKHQVEEAEKEAAADAEYQARLRQYERAREEWRNRVATGPNARCPNPKCHHTMRFNPSRIGTQFLCSSCNGVFPVRMAMARWTPPPPPKEPLPPKKNPGLWKRIFG